MPPHPDLSSREKVIYNLLSFHLPLPEIVLYSIGCDPEKDHVPTHSEVFYSHMQLISACTDQDHTRSYTHPVFDLE